MARDFNGTTDRIDYTSAFNTAGSPITISIWAWFDVLNPAASMFMFNSGITGGTSGTVFYQRTGANGTLAFFRNGSTGLDRITSANVVSTGRWQHCLLTHNGVMTTAASSKIFVNGIETDYVTTSNGATETEANSGFSIGGRLSDDLRNFNGRLAEVGVWNRVLSHTEILFLANRYKPSRFPVGLKFYTPLNFDYADRISKSGTLDGTTSIQHPLIFDEPKRYYDKLYVPAAAGGLVVNPFSGRGGGAAQPVYMARA